jgi:hypothetical protein
MSKIQTLEEAEKYLRKKYGIQNPTAFGFRKYLMDSSGLKFDGLNLDNLMDMMYEYRGDGDKNLAQVFYLIRQHNSPEIDLKYNKSLPMILNDHIRNHVTKRYGRCYCHIYKKKLVVSDGKKPIISFKPYFNKSGTVVVRPGKSNHRHIIGDATFHGIDHWEHIPNLPTRIMYIDSHMTKNDTWFVRGIELDHVRSILVLINKKNGKY